MASQLDSKACLHFCLPFFCLFSSLRAEIINIPKDQSTIQEGIDAASKGDTVLVAPGEYFEQILITGKRIVLGSWFLTTGDTSFISKTLIDGGGGRNLSLWIKGNKADSTTITGFSIRNGLDGIKCTAITTITDNHIFNCGDGIDYSAVSGGYCARNLIENSIAEAIDIDDEVSITIEDNIFRNNRSDGIEIQLQEYLDSTLTYIIRRNQIYGNGHDGIQLVENEGESNRFFLIEHNLIYKNGSSGVGLMGHGNLFEDFIVADIKDRVHLFNNTIASNHYGVIGGDNVIALNNLIINSRYAGMEDVDGNSIIAYCLLSGNSQDFEGCKVDSKTIIADSPFLDANFHYRGTGPGIDDGVASFSWNGSKVLSLASWQYSGTAPDIGAYEFIPVREVNTTLHIPSDYPTIRQGIDAAIEGDTVLVAPGMYIGEILLENKSILLGSWFCTTGDTSYIAQTIIDGGGEGVITVRGSAGSGIKIIGFTIRNGRDGIKTRAKLQVLNNRISNCEDGIDYESGSGGLCAFNIIENNFGEGLDLDRDIEIEVKENIIRNNGCDGIEIVLNEWDGDLLTYIIRGNEIYSNGEDGIQLVDEDGASNRVFYIERNVIDHNGFSGLGLMGNGNVEENFEGASIKDRIYLLNNTFVGNDHGVTGGDNMIALNNMFIDTKMTALKKVDGTSIVSYSLLWANGQNFEQSNFDSTTTLFTEPLIDENFEYKTGSRGIDVGCAFFVWQGDTVLNMPDSMYVGTAPDIGAFEYIPTTHIQSFASSQDGGFALLPNYPNPFNAQTVIRYELPAPNFVQLRILDALGREIRELVNAEKPAGIHTFQWDGLDANGVAGATGVYFYEMRAGNFVLARKLLLVR